jgi:hypothetical protein
MHRHHSLTAAVALLAIVPFAVAFPIWGESAGHDHGDPNAWMKAMTPGEPHAGLAEQAGEWRYMVSIWSDPAAEPMQIEGVSTKTMVMGGRFLREELSGEFMDRPFQGFGITGYNNVTEEYVAIWYDNTSTDINFYTGHEDKKGVRIFTAKTHDPVTGREIQTRSVGRVIDHDHHTFESYMTLPDGTEQLHMRVEYTRAAS